jgi:hypothetical protein
LNPKRDKIFVSHGQRIVGEHTLILSKICKCLA